MIPGGHYLARKCRSDQGPCSAMAREGPKLPCSATFGCERPFLIAQRKKQKRWRFYTLSACFWGSVLKVEMTA
jgi:hypothetical protein